MITFKNAIRRGEFIDCEIDHPQFGWIPFTASLDDSEEFGRAVYRAIVYSTDDLPYDHEFEDRKKAEARASRSVSSFQFRAMLIQAGYVEELDAAISELDPLSKLAWETEVTLYQGSHVVNDIANKLGIDAAQLDDLFKFAATIEP